MTSGHGTRGDKIIEGKTVEGLKCTPQTLHGLIDCLSLWVGPVQIITGSLGILDVVTCLEMLEALHLGVVNILGVGNKLRRRRSIGSRYFDVEDGLMV